MKQNGDFGGFSPNKKYINLSSQGDIRVESSKNTTGFLQIQSLILNPEVSL